MDGIEVALRPYGEGDLWVLQRTLGDASQMAYLNGPESAEKLRDRHARYVAMSADPHAGCMYTITAGPEHAAVGNIGYWGTEWDGQEGWETGWFVLPEFQGRGVATRAARLLADRVATLSHPFLFAYPSVHNGPSNAICRKLGFTLLGNTESEYPPRSGRLLRVNIWRLDLRASAATG